MASAMAVIDQVRKLINEGIQTSGNRSMDFNPHALILRYLFGPWHEKKRFIVPPSQTMSAHRNFFMHNCVFHRFTSSTRHRVVRPSSDAPARKSPNM